MEGALIVFIVVALLVLLVVYRTAVVVPQQSAYVVERLGRYHATLNAGFHILVPFVDVIRYRHTLKETAHDFVDPLAEGDHRTDRQRGEQQPLRPLRNR